MTDAWPGALPVAPDGTIEEGIPVFSRSGAIEGRTTGARLRCSSKGCPGWFIGVHWETGQRLRPCSEGWTYHPDEHVIRITGGGEISARVITPPPLGVPPTPREEWPTRETISGWKGWRVKP